MIPGAQFHRTHSDEDVRGYIDAAERILQEAGYDPAERIQLLPTIVGLVAAQIMVQQQQVAPVDLSRLTGSKLLGQ